MTGQQEGAHAVPYVCPFCGEEDLRPASEARWHCRSCLRLFTVTFYGLGSPDSAYPAPASELPQPTPASGIHLVDPPATPDDTDLHDTDPDDTDLHDTDLHDTDPDDTDPDDTVPPTPGSSR